MTRSCIRSSLGAALAAALLAPLPAAAQDVLFGNAGYQIVFDQTKPANQANFPPMVLTAGEDVFAGVAPADIQLRCSVYTGKKGVRATIGGTIGEGDDLETIARIPERSQNTDKNGWAEISWLMSEVDPVPNTSSNQLVAALLDVELGGVKLIEETEATCVLGIPEPRCQDGDTMVCFEKRHSVQVLDYAADGSLIEARVFDSSNRDALFFFEGTSVDIPLFFENLCNARSRVFFLEAANGPNSPYTIRVTDTHTGVVSQAGHPAGSEDPFLPLATCP